MAIGGKNTVQVLKNNEGDPEIKLIRELIYTLGRELKAIGKAQELNGKNLDELREQLDALRQILDYALLSSPANTPIDRLYPLTKWLDGRLKGLGERSGENDNLSVAQEISRMRAEIEEGLASSMQRTSRIAVETQDYTGDLDYQIEEIKECIGERVSNTKFYENFFFGLVIMVLLVNTFILVFLAQRMYY